MRSLIVAVFTVCFLNAPIVSAQSVRKFAKDDAYLVGINMAGAEFAPRALPGVENRNYGWPTAEHLDYWVKRKIRLIRLPFLWERLQPVLMKDFDPDYSASLKRVVKMIEKRKMLVVLDVHNYNHYRGKVISSKEVPLAAFADLWTRLAKEYKDSPSVWAYGLMNEPGGPWLKCAQAGIDGIRRVDKRTQIMVANDYPGWACSMIRDKSEAEIIEWAEKHMPISNPKLLKDPSKNLRFELHCYFDHNASGTYRKTYAFETKRRDDRWSPRVGPKIARDRMRPFVLWLNKHKVNGYIGEYGIPAGPGVDKRWMGILDDVLKYMQENKLSSTIWAAGRYWSTKPNGNGMIVGPNGWPRGWSAQKKLTEDRPQVSVLQKYSKPLGQ